MPAPRRRLLLSVTPRILGDSLARLLRPLDVEVVARDVTGDADVALVSEGRTAAADVVIELLDDGSCVVVHRDGHDRIIELRDATGLLAVLGEQLGSLDGHLEDDPGSATGCGFHGEGATH